MQQDPERYAYNERKKDGGHTWEETGKAVDEHILVIERDDEVRRRLVALLGDEGFEVEGVSDPEAGLAFLDSRTTVAVVTSSAGTSEDTAALVEAVGQACPRATVILVGPGTLVDEASMPSLPNLFLLEAPFEDRELLALARSALRTFRMAVDGDRHRAFLDGLGAVFATTAGDERCALLLELLLDVLDCETGSLMLKSEEGPWLEICSVKGLRERGLKGHRVSMGQGISGYVASTLQPLLLITGGRTVPQVSGFLRRGDEIGSATSIPLVARGELLGVVNLNRSPGSPRLERSDFRLARRLADTVAAVIDSTLAVAAMERQVIEAEKLASLGQLAAGIAHEVGSPLSVIQMAGELLERSCNRGGREREWARRVMCNAERIAEILDEVRSFYAPSEPREETVCLNQVARAALSAIRFRMRSSRIAFAEDLAEGLPRAAGSHGRLLRVVVNLLVNATQAIRDRGRVTVRTGTGEGGVFVEVDDTGDGISPAHKDRLFDPFFTTRQAEGGTGLGLAISRTMVREYGGDIVVESEPGRGSRFRVTLPGAAVAERTA